MNDISRNPAEEEGVRLISSFYEHLANGNVPAVLGLLDSEVRWTEAERFPYYSGTWIGPQAVLTNLLQRLASDWSDFAATPKKYLVEGTTIVAFGTYSGVYKPTGKSMRADFAHVWTVGDSKITSFLMYTDTAKVLEALAA
jgi:ketosteroid isomerase-like protein